MDWLFFFFFVLFLVIAIQPVVAQRMIRSARRTKLKEIEDTQNARVITLIHRQERVNLFGMSAARYIDMDDAQALIHAIQTTDPQRAIDLIVHTPGGLAIAAMQIARAIKAHPARVRVLVPYFAMSGGTLIALAADEIVMADFAMLGPVDPQIMNLPGASIARVKDQKPIEHIHDLTLVLADLSEKAIAQLRAGVIELVADRTGMDKASEMGDLLTQGVWTHDYAITPEQARAIGLTISTDMPETVLDLMTLYPQPLRQQPAVDFVPAEDTGRIRITIPGF